MVDVRGRGNRPRRRVVHLLVAFLVGLSVIAGLGATSAGAQTVPGPDIDLGTFCIGARPPVGSAEYQFTPTPGSEPSGGGVSAPDNVGFAVVTDNGAGGTFLTKVRVFPNAQALSTLGPFSLPITITIVYSDSATGLRTDTDSRTLNVIGTVVSDCTGPVVTVPGPVTVAPTSPSGANVSFTVTALDSVDGPVPATCDHSSGSLFPIGTTTVACTATDAAGNRGSASFTVTVSKPPPPVLSGVPADIVQEARGVLNGVGWKDPTAVDFFGASVPASCNPPGGGSFSLGTRTVVCTATDSFGNTTTASFTVTIKDTTPPVLPALPDITLPATSADGRVVTFGPFEGNDLAGGVILVRCSPASGATFPVGDTTVTCTADDISGNTSSDTFTVTITNTPPKLTVPADLTAEATGPAGAPVSFDPTATDTEDGTAPVACTPASGTTFALGTTAVDCTATDSGGLTATGSFTVTVKDTTAPTVTVPANLTVAPTGANGAVVTWPAATANDAVSGTLPTTCTPASGATFAAGTTATVTCSATDAAGNTGSASFTVTVQPFTFKGFFEPLQGCKPGVVVCNTAKGGSTVPLKFRIFAGTTELKTTNVVRSITQTPVSCTTGAATGPAQTRATTGLKYEAGDDNRFEYKWAVPRTGTCWQVTVTNTSGSSLSAIVKLKS